MRKKVIVVFLIVFTFTMLTGCQNNADSILLTKLKEQQIDMQQRSDYVGSVTLTLDKNRIENISENTQALLNFLPEANRFDFGINIYQTENALRISGYLSLLDEIRARFLSSLNILDIDLDLYIQKDLGVFLKSKNGYILASTVCPNYPDSLDIREWTQIADADTANRFWQTLLQLKNEEAVTLLLNDAVSITKSEKENGVYAMETDFNTQPFTNHLQNQLAPDADWLSQLLVMLMKLNDTCCVWQNSYKLNAETEKLEESAYQVSAQSDPEQWRAHPAFNDKAMDINIIIYRYDYPITDQSTIKPKELIQ